MDDLKRANHNALERKRRIHQKEKLQELRLSVPELRDSKPSTVDILLKSADHIGHLRVRHDTHEKEIQALHELNRSLMERLRLLAVSKDESISDFAPPKELLAGMCVAYALICVRYVRVFVVVHRGVYF